MDSKQTLEAHLLILAAGKSSRMGFPKGLIPFDGSFLIEAHLKNYQRAGGQGAHLVFGRNFQEYEEKMPWLSVHSSSPIPLQLSVDWSLNTHDDLGPFSSLVLGIRDIQKNHSKPLPLFVQPVDMPPVNQKTYSQLYRAMGKGIQACVPKKNETGGHPVLLHPSFYLPLIHIKNLSQARLDHQIKNLPSTAIQYLTTGDDAILQNWNSPGDIPS